MPKGAKYGGRQKGSLNKTTSELKSTLIELIEAEFESGKIQTTLAALEGKDYMNAIKDILPYIISKAPQDVNLEGGFIIVQRKPKADAGD